MQQQLQSEAAMEDLPDLPDLPVAWVRGQNAPSVHRGGVGCLSSQAQQIIGNVYFHVDAHREAMSALLRMRPHTSSARIVASLFGLPRRTVESQLRRMAEKGWVCSQPLRSAPVAAVGRRPLRPATPAEDLDDLTPALPEIAPSAVIALWGDESTADESTADLAPPAASASAASASAAASAAGTGAASASAPPAASASAASAAGTATTVIGCIPVDKLGVDTHAFTQACWKACAQQTKQSLPSINSLDVASKNKLAALRVGTLVVKLIADGATLNGFEDWIQTLDSLFPGEFGELNHSRYFAEQFSNTLLQMIEVSSMCELQCLLPALQIPSDFARVIDGITVSIGEGLLIHILIAMGRDGVMRWHLLDLTPQGVMAPATHRSNGPDPEDKEARLAHDDEANLADLVENPEQDGWGLGAEADTVWTGFQRAGPTVDKCHAVEGRYCIFDADRVHRYAVNIGDGAVEGPHGKDIGALSASRSGLPQSFPWGSSDQAHCVDKAGARADKLEKGPRGYLTAYMHAAEQIRHLFGFGKGRVIIRAIVKKYGLVWRRPHAPHSSQTRTILYESKRVPPNFLRNLPAVVYGLRFKLREAIEGSRRQSAVKRRKTLAACGVHTKVARQLRALGQSVVEPQMLLYICLRYDHRRLCTLQYAQEAQSVELTGIHLQTLQDETDVAMMWTTCAVRAIIGIMDVAMALVNVVPKAELEAFITTLVYAVALRQLPTLVPALLEFVFRGSFRGVALGLAKLGRHPFAEPGVARTNVSKRQALTSRMQDVSKAMERGLAWAKEERRQFQMTVMMLQPAVVAPTSAQLAGDEGAAGAAPATATLTAAVVAPTSARLAAPATATPAADADSGEDDVASIAVSIDASSDAESEGSTATSGSSASTSVARATNAGVGADAAKQPASFDMIISPSAGRGSRIGSYTLSDWRRRRWLEWQRPVAEPTVWDHRKQLLACAVRLFHVDRLIPPVHDESVGDEEDNMEREQGLRVLHRHFGPLLFHHSKDTCPYTSPPPELFSTPTDTKLWSQYCQLRELIRNLQRKYPDKIAEVEELVGVDVEYENGRHKRLSARLVKWKSLQRVISEGHEYEIANTQRFGQVRILRRVYKKVDHKMHGLLMTMSYAAVRGMWHILRLYHRVLVWSSSSEAIAEHVASLIRYVEKKHSSGKALAVPALVRATRLRAAGLRGDSTDSSLIMRAMSIHFQKQKGPHFFLTRPRTKAVLEDMLGPSVSVSTLRSKILATRKRKHVWLSQGMKANHMAKPIRRTRKSVDYVPDDLPSSVWDSVGVYLDNFEMGTEELPKQPQQQNSSSSR